MCKLSSKWKHQNYVSWKNIAVRKAYKKDVENSFFQVKRELQQSNVPEILNQIYNPNFTESRGVEQEVALMSQRYKKFIQILDEGTRLKLSLCNSATIQK